MTLTQLRAVLKKGKRLETIFKLKLNFEVWGREAIVFAVFEKFGMNDPINPSVRKKKTDSWKIGFNHFISIAREEIVSLEPVSQIEIQDIVRSCEGILGFELDGCPEAVRMKLLSLFNSLAKCRKKANK